MVDTKSSNTPRPWIVQRAWQARWIWVEGDGSAPNHYRYFRKVFPFAGDPVGCRIFITADTRYQLFVNGQFVGRGSPPSQPYFQYYDEHDLSGVLQEGDNCIAVIVNYVGNHADTRGGLLAEVLDATGAMLAASVVSLKWTCKKIFIAHGMVHVKKRTSN
jgi:alpha-L-rhamnosidase